MIIGDTESLRTMARSLVPTCEIRMSSGTQRVPGLRCIELFAGAGGLAIAAHKSGFRSMGLFERDSAACTSLKANRRLVGLPDASGVHQVDLRAVDPRELDGSCDVLLGGPPCQPFSRAGVQRGHLDERDLFPNFVDFVHGLKPRAFVIENVAGIFSGRFERYFARIVGSLSYASKRHPGVLKISQGVPEFRGRSRPDYRVYFKILNAADYGVPQNRLRLFVVGMRSDQNIDWKWPTQTHSREALLRAKYVTGRYFVERDLRRTRYEGRLSDLEEKLANSEGLDRLRPHVTVRDAISDLPIPIRGEEVFSHHLYVPGARAYDGHTGSRWDEPSKTIKAGVHGCPGGENMIQLSGGRVRYFTTRELARLQGFPDSYRFHGTRNQCIRQIGNAVPVQLGVKILTHLSSMLSA